MKKIIVSAFALLMILTCIIGISANSSNANYGNVPTYTGSIVQDGVMDAAYETFGKHFENTAYEKIVGDALPGYTAEQWWLFTDNYQELHVFCRVVDPTLLVPTAFSHQTIEMCHHTDCIELYIDPTNELTGHWSDSSTIDAKAYNYRCDASGFVSATMWGKKYLGADKCAKFFSANVVLRDDGYDVEFIVHTNDFLKNTSYTKFERGVTWGIQTIAKNVYDERQYLYEWVPGKQQRTWEDIPGGHQWDLGIYAMNSFTFPTKAHPTTATYHTAEFDYITLGNSVSDEEENPNCPETGTHTWGEWIKVTEKDCENAGLLKHVCTACGTESTVVDPPVGHVSSKVTETDSTCSVPGHTAGEICSVCGVPMTGCYDKELLPHTPTSVEAQAPSCTEPGHNAGVKCEVCGEVIEGCEEIPATGHTPNGDPDCAAEIKCVTCGEVIKEAGVHVSLAEIPAVDATCTAPGKTAGVKCEFCGEFVTEPQDTDPLPHTFKDGKCEVCGTEDPDYIKENPFRDVGKKAWFKNAVDYVFTKGLMTGTTDETFAPNVNMSRAMLVSVLYRYYGSPEPTTANKFADVSNKKSNWYLKAVTWAAENDVVAGIGDGTKFDPEGNVTREQIASIFYRFASYLGRKDLEGKSFANFDDAKKVSKWAKTSMEWAVNESLLQGSNNKLNPAGNATRAEVAAILMRFCQNPANEIKPSEKAPQDQIDKLVSDMETIHIFFNGDIPDGEKMSIRSVLTLFLYDNGYHGHDYTVNQILKQHPELGYRDAEALALQTLAEQGWVPFDASSLGIYSGSGVYALSVPHSAMDSWTQKRFGTTYSFIPNALYYLTQTMDATFDVPNCIFDKESDTFLFLTFELGWADPPEMWSDHSVYQHTHTVDGDTVTFDYTYYTIDTPDNTDGLNHSTVYLSHILWGIDYGENYMYVVGKDDEGAYEATVWEVPYQLTFRYSGETFEFVSMGRK